MNRNEHLGRSKKIILSGLLGVTLLFPAKILAVEVNVIGATEEQAKLIACIASSSVGDLEITGARGPLTVIVLDRKKFREMQHSFRAFKTDTAFSSIKARRIYLRASSVKNFKAALKYVAHELGHFESNSLFEDQAELRATRIRRHARRVCG